MEDLDGDVAIVADIVREIDGCHAAGSELAVDAIAIGKGGGQSRENVVVRHEAGPKERKSGSAASIEVGASIRLYGSSTPAVRMGTCGPRGHIAVPDGVPLP